MSDFWKRNKIVFIEGTCAVFKTSIGRKLENTFRAMITFHSTDYGSLKQDYVNVFKDKTGLLAIPCVFIDQIVKAAHENNKNMIHVFDRSYISPYMYQFIHKNFDKVPHEDELKALNMVFPSTTITCINTDIEEVKKRLLKRNLFDAEFILKNENYIATQNEIFTQFANLSQTPLLDLRGLKFEDCFNRVAHQIEQLLELELEDEIC
jgi:deoxyadenosine/deoxycytidine kinase